VSIWESPNESCFQRWGIRRTSAGEFFIVTRRAPCVRFGVDTVEKLSDEQRARNNRIQVTGRVIIALRAPEPYFEKLSTEAKADAVEMAAQLIESHSGKFQHEKMPNEYARAVHELVRAKVEHRAQSVELVDDERPAAPVINIMAALKESMQSRDRPRSATRCAGAWSRPRRRKAREAPPSRAARVHGARRIDRQPRAPAPAGALSVSSLEKKAGSQFLIAVRDHILDSAMPHNRRRRPYRHHNGGGCIGYPGGSRNA
jgi:hypothetical protein